jgi:hypothetical protein
VLWFSCGAKVHSSIILRCAVMWTGVLGSGNGLFCPAVIRCPNDWSEAGKG